MKEYFKINRIQRTRRINLDWIANKLGRAQIELYKIPSLLRAVAENLETDIEVQQFLLKGGESNNG